MDPFTEIVRLIKSNVPPDITPKVLAEQVCPEVFELHKGEELSDHQCLYYVGESYAGVSKACDDWGKLVQELIKRGRTNQEEVFEIWDNIVRSKELKNKN